MKHLPKIAGAILGLMFIAFSIIYFFKLQLMDRPAPLAGSPVALFMGALIPSGFMDFVKACEFIGGLLVAIPRTRNFGLLVLGPIIVNILAFHVFLTNRAGLADPALIVICLLAVYLLWVERRAFGNLLKA